MEGWRWPGMVSQNEPLTDSISLIFLKMSFTSQFRCKTETLFLKRRHHLFLRRTICRRDWAGNSCALRHAYPLPSCALANAADAKEGSSNMHQMSFLKRAALRAWSVPRWVEHKALSLALQWEKFTLNYFPQDSNKRGGRHYLS